MSKRKKNKENHGGAREGAGRPTKEKTTTMRVPVALVQDIKELIAKKAK